MLAILVSRAQNYLLGSWVEFSDLSLLYPFYSSIHSSLKLDLNNFLFTGTPLQFVNREKSSSACRSIGDSIKKHIFHKSLYKSPKRYHTNSPSSSKAPRTPLTGQVSNRRTSLRHSCNQKLKFHFSMN